MLEAVASVWAVRDKLLPLAMQADTDVLVDILFEARTQEVRNLAAACLATVATQGREGIDRAVNARLAFEPGASATPWDDGPLFIPSIQWTREQARALTSSLVSWHLWCELRERRAEQTQIHNNLRGVGLAQMAGYQSPGWNEVGTEQWLEVWGRAAGRDAIERLLRLHGLAGVSRWNAVLERTP